MSPQKSSHPHQRSHKEFLIGLARAGGGALLFGLPLFMTMEMWWLGFSMPRLQLILLLLVNFPFLVGLSHYSGFEKTEGLLDDVLSAFVAYGVGILTAALSLSLLAIITPQMPLSEIMSKIALQAIAGSIGALLARTQLGAQSNREKREKRSHYFGELFIMLVGAIFVGLNLAPTEEIILISFQMSAGHALLLILVSLLLMHAFVYSIGFKGQETIAEGISLWQVFLRFTIVGYAIAWLTSLFILWTFGRTEGLGLAPLIIMSVVLGFPNALGAAAARLIL
ncbi:TIGR02587 family membrane protein [Anaerolineales bacterium]